jgi:hypothetical protein
VKNIESDEWIIFLGSCDEEYELFVRNESLFTLKARKGPIYLIECKSGQKFKANGIKSGQTFRLKNLEFLL